MTGITPQDLSRSKGGRIYKYSLPDGSTQIVVSWGDTMTRFTEEQFLEFSLLAETAQQKILSMDSIDALIRSKFSNRNN